MGMGDKKGYIFQCIYLHCMYLSHKLSEHRQRRWRIQLENFPIGFLNPACSSVCESFMNPRSHHLFKRCNAACFGQYALECLRQKFLELLHNMLRCAKGDGECSGGWVSVRTVIRTGVRAIDWANSDGDVRPSCSMMDGDHRSVGHSS